MRVAVLGKHGGDLGAVLPAIDSQQARPQARQCVFLLPLGHHRQRLAAGRPPQEADLTEFQKIDADGCLALPAPLDALGDQPLLAVPASQYHENLRGLAVVHPSQTDCPIGHCRHDRRILTRRRRYAPSDPSRRIASSHRLTMW